jgi:putative ABC transport system permease protein
MSSRFRQRVRALFRREDVLSEIGDELRHHAERLAERLEADGMSRRDALAEARRRVGNIPMLQDAGYDVRGGGWVETFLRDVRYGLRILRAYPGFTLTAVLTLALGIGANTAIFSVASGVLLRPLPYPGADRIAMVWMDNARINLREDWHSYPNYEDYRDQSSTFAHMAAFNTMARTFADGGEPERVIGAHSTANLFAVLGVSPLHGRTYDEKEGQPGGEAVVVLSHGLWQRRFGGRADLVNSTIQMNGASARVIGIMPAGFAFPVKDTAFWIPTPLSEQSRTSRGSLWLQVVGRMKPGVSVEQAQADLSRVNAGILERFPQQKGYTVYVVSHFEQIVGRIRPAVLVLLGAVGFVLLIACTNVANLLLARASTRERELALRAAIGAGRGRLIRQMLTESLLLSVIGGLAGLGLAWLGLDALLATAPPDLPRLDEIRIDARVLVFTLGLSVATGLLFGVAPALQTAGADPGRTLKEGGRGATTVGRSLRRALVVLEVALAVVLLVGAGLMIRSFINVQRVDLGFVPDRVLTARIGLFGPGYRQPGKVTEFFRELVTRHEASPGIEGAAAVGTLFLSATPNSTNFSIEGRPDFTPEERIEVPVDSITPNYFSVMRVPLLAGRFFDERDAAGAPETVIINDSMARMFWPGEDPVGRRIKYGQLDSQGPWMTIVGVVGDTRRTGLDAAVRPETYLPHAQAPSGGMTVVVRTIGEPEAAVSGLRSVVRSIDPTIPLFAARSVDDLLDDMTAQRRLNTLLLSVFGAVAALVAAVGVYGVLAYSVQQRRRELGVRVALGATAGTLLRLVLTEGLTLAGAGLVIGLLGALALGRVLTSLLYGVSATDPATLAAIAGLAGFTALLACLVPAIRAVRVDPTSALRAD